MRIDNRLTRGVIASLLGLMAPLSALAQSTTLALLRPEVTASRCPYPECEPGPAAVIEVDVEGGRVASRRTVPFEHAEIVRLAATADGRYLVWLGNEVRSFPLTNLTLFDRATGSAGVLLSQPQPSGGIFARDYRIFAHPRELRVLAALYQLPIIDASANGIRGIDVGGQFQTLHGLTADGRVALLSREDGVAPQFAVRVDTATGTVLGQFPVSEHSQLAISPDGAFVYGARLQVSLGSASAEIYTRYDAVTGARLGEVVIPSLSPLVFGLSADPRTGRVYAQIPNARFRVLDPITLLPLGIVSTPLPPLPSSEPYPGRAVAGRLVFDPHHPRAFLLATREARRETGDRGVTRVDIIDTSTLTLAGGADLGMEVGPVDLTVVPRPSAPGGLAADVAGARVTLRWNRGSGPGVETGYRIEAGSAPGLANLASVSTDPSTVFVVDNVPPGTYYVRVRAVNRGGASAASAEITVAVP